MMMELEAAIGWLVQTILASLLISELDAWIGHVGLADDISSLKSEIKRVKMVVSAVAVKGRDRPLALAESLADLKELLYDADDVVDELDYYRLQQQLQGEYPSSFGTVTLHGPEVIDGAARVDETSMGDADIPPSISRGNLRSKAWDDFVVTRDGNGNPVKAECKYCHKIIQCKTRNGTGVLSRHVKSASCGGILQASHQLPNPSSTGDAAANATPVATGGDSSTRKRRRDEEPTHVTAANTNPWNKDDFSNRIQDITRQLQDIREDVRGVLMILGSDSGASSNHYQSTTSHPRLRTSSLVQGKVYGRDAEKKSIIKLIKEHKSAGGVTVLPIVGIGGVGKTALAQLVYNDPALESQFEHRIWSWVSNNFDEMRLSREMLDFVSQETHEGLCSFAKLQEVLRGHIKSKRVLLVLDDVWDDMNDCRWNQLLAPFKSNDAKGNMILVTTRKPSVAKRSGTAGPIKLGALENDDFWFLFKACAFGDENYEVQASLSDLGRQIARKLKGNPLAAETAGALLREHLTVDHWSNILKNEDWKSLQLSSGIMPALKLCYDQLPYHLQQCFSYCSIFPYNYLFHAEELVRIWISQGFVKCNDSSMRLEEIGRYYLTELVNLGFFEHVTGSSSYAMCDLMHDFARVVSRTECATMDGLQCNEMLPTVHHLSIVTNSVYQREYQTGNIPRNEKFEEKLRKAVTSVRKLRTLVLIGQYDSLFFQSFQDVFQKAHSLRLLQMSATSADFHSFLCSLVNPTHLRHLKLRDGHVEQGALPQVSINFFHLQVLDGAWLASLQTVYLEDCGEWRLLPSLERLPFLTKLKLSNMRKVREVSVPSLEELVLVEMPELERCSCTSVGALNSSLRVLEIQSCHALKWFDLFEKEHNFEIEQNSWLPGLRKLIIRDCPHLQVLNPLPPSTTFSELLISRVSTLLWMEGSSSETLKIGQNSLLTMTLDDKILAFHNLRDLKNLDISYCRNLTSISFEGFSQLVSIKSLEISLCGKLFSSDVLPEHTHEDVIAANCIALPSLKSLSIISCGITGKWLSLMLRHAPTLKELSLRDSLQVTQLSIEEEENTQANLITALTSLAPDGLLRIPLNLTSSLKKIDIYYCRRLTFSGSKEGFAGFTSLEELIIRECPELFSSLVHNDGNGDQANGRWLLPQSLGQLEIENYSQETLRPCFLGNLTCLKKLRVAYIPSLKSLQLHSCMSLEDLRIKECESLAALEGLQSLGSLRNLDVRESPMLESLQLHSCTSLEDLKIDRCESLAALEGLQSLVKLRNLEVFGFPGLAPCLERFSGQGYELCPRLESLFTDDVSLLTTSFCKGLTCLQRLQLEDLACKVRRLTDEQERALLLLRSLQELLFVHCYRLVHLPTVLHSLPSLKTLMIEHCYGISRLPKEGLPPSLEELEISRCSHKLSEQCRLLATSKLRVKIIE